MAWRVAYNFSVFIKCVLLVIVEKDDNDDVYKSIMIKTIANISSLFQVVELSSILHILSLILIYRSLIFFNFKNNKLLKV